MSKYRPLGLEDAMPFGKFKGTKLRVVLMEKPDYIRWLLVNMQDFNLDDQANARLEALEEETQRDDGVGADVYPWDRG